MKFRRNFEIFGSKFVIPNTFERFTAKKANLLKVYFYQNSMNLWIFSCNFVFKGVQCKKSTWVVLSYLLNEVQKLDHGVSGSSKKYQRVLYAEITRFGTEAIYVKPF